jgi:thioredoxin 1
MNRQKSMVKKVAIIFLVLATAGLLMNRLIARKGSAPAEAPALSGAVETKTSNKSSNMEHLTKETFLKKVFNYEKNQEWKYEGELPCLIDFYADWCGPCKMVAPILEELSKEYDGKIVIYKIDTEVEQELAAAFGIRSIPSLLFCPVEGQPQMAAGALPKATMKKAIDEILLAEKAEVK